MRLVIFVDILLMYTEAYTKQQAIQNALLPSFDAKI